MKRFVAIAILVSALASGGYIVGHAQDNSTPTPPQSPVASNDPLANTAGGQTGFELRQQFSATENEKKKVDQQLNNLTAQVNLIEEAIKQIRAVSPPPDLETAQKKVTEAYKRAQSKRPNDIKALSGAINILVSTFSSPLLSF